MPAVAVDDASLNYTTLTGIGSLIVDRTLQTTTTTATTTDISDGAITAATRIPSLPPLPLPAALSANDPSAVSDTLPGIWFNHRQVAALHDVQNFGFVDEDDTFGSPLPFDASEHGLWNGRFVPPPPRPPFLEDTIVTDGVTTCDLCSWAMPTKNTFIFEGTIEKATELGWPLTLIIVSIISAILGAIVMVTVVKCKRKKSTNRNETHVQWWSRNKRTTSSQIRRNNIYTAHPADSIRGLHTTNEACNWSNVTSIVATS